MFIKKIEIKKANIIRPWLLVNNKPIMKIYFLTQTFFEINIRDIVKSNDSSVEDLKKYILNSDRELRAGFELIRADTPKPEEPKEGEKKKLITDFQLKDKTKLADCNVDNNTVLFLIPNGVGYSFVDIASLKI